MIKKTTKKNIMTRYFIIIMMMGLVGLAVIVKAGYIMFFKKAYWETVDNKFIVENIPILPVRGNIISSDGKLLATNLPQYKIYMDFKAGNIKTKDKKSNKEIKSRDSLFRASIPAICKGLHDILPDMSASQFRKRILDGYEKKTRCCLLYPYRISYIKYKMTKRIPFLCLPANKSGYYAEQYNQRIKMFGSLAAKTLGEMVLDTTKKANKKKKEPVVKAKNGLEFAYDSVLRGTPGKSHRQKVMNKYLNIVDIPPVDGCDIVSSIDVSMQDISEKALVDELKAVNGDVGVVILMEVGTGDVKAIVNMTKCADGSYHEIRNTALTSLMEPGSTFKTASIMVGLEDGMFDLNDGVNTQGGIVMMHGRPMKDWNWYKGGYHYLTVPQIMMKSSNIGVSTLIDSHYFNNPQKFVRGLYREGINADLKLPIPGVARARIRMPNKNNWSKTALAWMSIGYETQIPPINMATFYNAIANNGVMVRPRFVTQILKNGKVVQDIPVGIIKKSICSKRTLDKIHTILWRVVNMKGGLGKPARSSQFYISGKTGTAQIAHAGGYKSGGTSYLLSFAGYFPSEAPKYSMYVAIQKRGLPASGGLMAGSVFHKIAERIYAKNLSTNISRAVDSDAVFVPDVKVGNVDDMKEILNGLEIQNLERFKPVDIKAFGTATHTGNTVYINPQNISLYSIPNVIGMGARDAVYLMEKCGLHVRLYGTGKVYWQSIPQGTKINKGMTVAIRLN